MEKVLNPDLQFSVMCDDVRQERNGKFILIGLFDVVSVASLPAVFPRICIVNRWCCGQGEFVEKTRVVSPDNGPIVAEGKDIAVRLPVTESTVTNIEFFINVVFKTEGVYWVEVLLDGDMNLRYPLRVNLIRQPRTPSADGG